MKESLLSQITCRCPSGVHEPKLVVLTGGPGAGKTAVLEIAKRNFCEHIAILPEAASIVFGGGFWRRDSLAARKGAQRSIFQIQRELEKVVLDEGKAAIGLCDRGTLDGLAYWPEKQDNFFHELGIQREQELKRYLAVIHLRTPAQHQGYNHSNPVRIENAEEAYAVDQKIFKAWEGHPNRVIIESSNNFLEKATKAIEAILKWLPSCCQSHPIRELERDATQ